jgi:hypothetical protein
MQEKRGQDADDGLTTVIMVTIAITYAGYKSADVLTARVDSQLLSNPELT